ncbi:MAG: hypothetical protein J6P44_05580 [Bacteroidales bacterium]|nr:hypothetical protein [Bacteroidales bacterium]
MKKAKTLLIAALAIFAVSCGGKGTTDSNTTVVDEKAEPVEVSGVVTGNYDKPFVGAQVYLAPATDSINVEMVKDAIKLEIFLGKQEDATNMYAKFGSIDWKETVDKFTNKMSEIEDTYQLSYEDIIAKAQESVDKVKNNPKVYSATVDASGKFSIKAKPGKYYLLVLTKDKKWHDNSGDNPSLSIENFNRFDLSETNVNENGASTSIKLRSIDAYDIYYNRYE